MTGWHRSSLNSRARAVPGISAGETPFSGRHLCGEGLFSDRRTVSADKADKADRRLDPKGGKKPEPVAQKENSVGVLGGTIIAAN
jgi:hypothetical protein